MQLLQSTGCVRAVVIGVVTYLDAESGLPQITHAISGVRFEVRGFNAGMVRVFMSGVSLE